MDIDKEIEDVLDDQPMSILDFMHLWYLILCLKDPKEHNLAIQMRFWWRRAQVISFMQREKSSS
jgi:hypothetical protein